MIDVPDTLHSHRERGRLTAQGRCDDSTCTLLVIHEAGGSRAIHDTHHGKPPPNGPVAARCGIQFAPRPLPRGTVALPGHPYNHAQICPECSTTPETR
jgi:hypothetical protein